MTGCAADEDVGEAVAIDISHGCPGAFTGGRFWEISFIVKIFVFVFDMFFKKGGQMLEQGLSGIRGFSRGTCYLDRLAGGCIAY